MTRTISKVLTKLKFLQSKHLFNKVNLYWIQFASCYNDQTRMELRVPKLNALMTVILMVGLITYVILTKFVLVMIKLRMPY